MRVIDLSRRWLLGLASAAATSAVAAPPPIEDFLRPPEVGEVALSPAGTHLAMTVRGQKGFLQLAVMPLDAPEKGKVIDAFSDGNVEEVRWVNESRLVYGASNPQAQGYQRGAWGLFAIDRDGGQRRHLVAHRKDFLVSRSSANLEARTLEWQFDYHAPVHDGSPDVIVGERQFDGLGDEVGREHANRFRAAAERAGVKVEWVSYPGEGHGWRSPAIKLDFWKRVVAFLGKHLDEPR